MPTEAGDLVTASGVGGVVGGQIGKHLVDPCDHAGVVGPDRRAGTGRPEIRNQRLAAKGIFDEQHLIAELTANLQTEGILRPDAALVAGVPEVGVQITVAVLAGAGVAPIRNSHITAGDPAQTAACDRMGRVRQIAILGRVLVEHVAQTAEAAGKTGGGGVVRVTAGFHAAFALHVGLARQNIDLQLAVAGGRIDALEQGRSRDAGRMGGVARITGRDGIPADGQRGGG